MKSVRAQAAGRTRPRTDTLAHRRPQEPLRPDLGLRDYSQSLSMILLRAREAVLRQTRPTLRGQDVTEQQWRVLRTLAAVDAAEITELARATCLLPPSLTRILRTLQRRKLIRRRAVPSDLRRTVVSITEKGWKVVAAVAPDSTAAYDEITRRFGSDRLRAVEAMLVDLTDALAPDAVPPPPPRPRRKS